MSAPTPPSAYEFGDFRADVRQRLLVHKEGGRPIVLHSRAFDTLLYFLDHPAEVIDRSTLMAAVWPNVVVDENNLSQHVSALRRALGERAEEHRYIVTIPGRGYQFVATVRPVPDTVTAPPADIATSQPVPSAATPAGTSSASVPWGLRSRRWWLVLSAGIASLAIAVAALVSLKSPPAGQSPAALAVAAAAPQPAAYANSIAVLPFVDMSEKHDQEYFADGLSEELINLLARVPDLHVPARTSSFYFKGKPTPISDIARKLNVANVLEGSVRKSGNTLRISANLVRVDSGYEVWSQTYGSDVKDIFQIQDQIAAAVVQALKAKLLSSEAAAYRPADPEAYSLLLQARFLKSQGSERHLRSAISALERAVALDPNYAMAWAELAQSCVFMAGYVDAEPTHDLAASRAAIREALRLNPTDAGTRYLLAMIKIAVDHDWSGAAAEIEAARLADPALTEPEDLAIVTGRNTEAFHREVLRRLSRDIERDPLNADALISRGASHYYASEIEAAEADLREGLTLDSRSLLGKWYLARVLLLQRKAAEALSIVETMPEHEYRRAAATFVYQALGRKAEAESALRELVAKDAQDGPFEIAVAYLLRGDTPAALDWLQRDYDLQRFGLLLARGDPMLKPLAREPRFLALMNKLAPVQ